MIWRNSKLLKTNKAFTLAEVLITLGIIGVIAAIVIPIIINSSKNQETVAKLKKYQSVLSQAVINYSNDNGCIGDLASCNLFNNGIISGAGSVTAWTALKGYFNITKDCGSAINTGCIPIYKTLIDADTTFYGDQFTASNKAILSDGSILQLVDYTGNCNIDNSLSNNTPLYYTCGYFIVDINGNYFPNKLGRDVFLFFITKNANIYPIGISDDTFTTTTYCNTSPSATDTSNGISCTAKVLNENAVNY